MYWMKTAISIPVGQQGNDRHREDYQSKYDVLELKQMIQEHVATTNSVKGKQILDSL